MKGIWLRLGRTDAINWIVITVVATLQFVGSFVISNPKTMGKELLYLWAVTCSVLLVIAMLLLTRYLLIPFVSQQARPFAIVIMLQVTAIARAFVFEALLLNYDLTEPGLFLTRIYGSQSNIFVAGIVVSSLVSMARDFSESNERLSITIAQLREAQENLDTRVKARQANLISFIKSQLESSITSLTGTNLNKDAQSLKKLIDDVVRPISHRLGREFDFVTDTVPSPPSRQIRWSSVTRNALRTNPIHPVWLTTWAAFVSLQVIAVAFGSAFFVPYLFAVSEFALWFVVSRLVWQFAFHKIGLLLRAILFSILMLSTSVVVNFLIDTQFGVHFFTPRSVISGAIYFFVIAWSIALVISVSDLLKSTNTELISAKTSLRRQLVADNVNARHFEQSVSHILHGPIQDAIAASLRRIQSRSVPNESVLSEAELIREHIESSLNLLHDSSMRNYSVERGLTDLVNLWSGVVTIEVRCEKETLDVLLETQATSSIVIEVVREAVSNGIRHGDSSTIAVSINIVNDGEDIEIIVTNDGKLLPEDPVPGIGTQILDSMTVGWTRNNQANGVVLRALVPIEKMKKSP